MWWYVCVRVRDPEVTIVHAVQAPRSRAAEHRFQTYSEMVRNIGCCYACYFTSDVAVYLVVALWMWRRLLWFHFGGQWRRILWLHFGCGIVCFAFTFSLNVAKALFACCTHSDRWEYVSCEGKRELRTFSLDVAGALFVCFTHSDGGED